MARHLLLIFVVLAGAGIPVQVASNRRLEEAVRSPLLAVAISFLIGGLAIALLASVANSGRLSGVSILAVVGMGRRTVQRSGCDRLDHRPAAVGAGAVIAATVLGQLLAAAVLDHFGWLGVPQVRINWWRICGMMLLLGGALLMQKK